MVLSLLHKYTTGSIIVCDGVIQKWLGRLLCWTVFMHLSSSCFVYAYYTGKYWNICGNFFYNFDLIVNLIPSYAGFLELMSHLVAFTKLKLRECLKMIPKCPAPLHHEVVLSKYFLE